MRERLQQFGGFMAGMIIPNIGAFIAWGNWAYSETINLQWGCFNTPMGIINIQHWDPLLLEHIKPMFLRPMNGATLFPNQLLGFNMHGRMYFGDSDNMAVGYDAFLGVYAANRKNMHIGARVAFMMMEQGMNVGLNYMHGTRRSGSTAPCARPCNGPTRGRPGRRCS